MKIKKPVKPRIVKIRHTQAIKQSINYQSADCSYSVEVEAEDTPAEIKKAFKRVEDMVEEQLGIKVPQQRGFLRKIGEDQAYEVPSKGRRRS